MKNAEVIRRSSDGRGRSVRAVKRRSNKISKKQKVVFLMAIFLFYMVNVVFLSKVQSQINDINRILSQVLEVMSLTQDKNGRLIPEQEQSPEASDSGRNLGDGVVAAVSEDYVNLCGLSEVAKPEKRTEAEVLERLKELAEEDEVIAGIYKTRVSYPQKMLEALANNPEMADFVAGYLTSEAKATGEGLTEDEKEQECPLFLQWDPRWGYAAYGEDSNIGLAGCGPTCLSMALYALLGDEKLTPDWIAEYSMKNNYYVAGTGTAWALLQELPTHYGLAVSQPQATDQTMKTALDQGNIIICSMEPGDFTAAGHFIVIYGYDSKGFQVNDPNCVARSREQWTFEKIGNQIKHLWVLGEKTLDTIKRVEYDNKK